MLKKIPFLAILVFCACSSEQKPSKSPFQTFYQTHVLFNMDTEVERIPCKIQGNIPLWLSGTLLRNGPAKFQVGDQRVDWFDGLAMLHAFEFNPHQVFYSNRFLRSRDYYIMTVKKSINVAGFAQDPCPMVLKNQMSQFVPPESQNIGNADVTIKEYADKMVALTEAPLPVIFDQQTLDTLGVFNYQDNLLEGQWQCAHSQHDLSAQETVSYFVRFGEKSSYVIWRMPDQQSTREVIAEIPVESPSYMHSFALTENYIVLTAFPLVVNPMELAERKKPFIFNYKWEPERGTLFYIVNRSSGEVVKIKEAPFFAFHHANAFDKEGEIFMDIITYSNANIIKTVTNRITTEKGAEESEKTKLERFTIAVDTQKVSRETLFDQDSIEMPRVREDLITQKYRYCYVLNSNLPTSIKEKFPLYKIDVMTKTNKSWSEEGCAPGEPIFVPRPGGQGEDDGVVLSLILDFAHHHSFLLVLDGRNFTELARAPVPHAVPLGLHGLWKGKEP